MKFLSQNKLQRWEAIFQTVKYVLVYLRDPSEATLGYIHVQGVLPKTGRFLDSLRSKTVKVKVAPQKVYQLIFVYAGCCNYLIFDETRGCIVCIFEFFGRLSICVAYSQRYLLFLKNWTIAVR